MSNNEKEILSRLAMTIPQLNEENRTYIAGLVDGMALSKEHRTERHEARTEELVC